MSGVRYLDQFQKFFTAHVPPIEFERKTWEELAIQIQSTSLYFAHSTNAIRAFTSRYMQVAKVLNFLLE